MPGLSGQQLCRGYGGGNCRHAMAVIDADDCCRKDAQGQEPLESSCAFSAILRGQALRQVERNQDAHESSADALQQAAKEGDEAVRECDDRILRTKIAPLMTMSGFASQPVGEQAGEERRDNAAQQHGGDNDR